MSASNLVQVIWAMLEAISRDGSYLVNIPLTPEGKFAKHAPLPSSSLLDLCTLNLFALYLFCCAFKYILNHDHVSDFQNRLS
jgi:hypothetical protein